MSLGLWNIQVNALQKEMSERMETQGPGSPSEVFAKSKRRQSLGGSQLSASVPGILPRTTLNPRHCSTTQPAASVSLSSSLVSQTPLIQYQCEICLLRPFSRQEVWLFFWQVWIGNHANWKLKHQVRAHLLKSHRGVLEELGEGPDMLFCALPQGELKVELWFSESFKW